MNEPRRNARRMASVVALTCTRTLSLASGLGEWAGRRGAVVVVVEEEDEVIV